MTLILEESFEATGYDITSPAWTETTTAGSVDEDSAGPGTMPPYSAGSQCLRIQKTSTSQQMVKTEINEGTNRRLVYMRFYFYVASHNLGSDAAFDAIAGIRESTGNTAATVQIGTSGTQLQVRGSVRNSSLAWLNTTAANISTGQWYCVEMCWNDTGGEFKFYLDGSQVGSTISADLYGGGTPGARIYHLGGHYALAARTWDIYYDLFAVDNSTYIGTGAPPPDSEWPTETAVDIAASVATLADLSALSSPRHKVVFDPSDADTLYVVFGNSATTGSVYTSTNKGNTWAAVGTQVQTDYHANLDIDSSGRLFVGTPAGWDGTDVPGELRRWNGSSWDTDIAFDDYSGAYSMVHATVGNGNDVFVFVRSTYGVSGDLYWHRSTDNGETFGSANLLLATGDTNWKRVGSLFLNGQPAAQVGYDAGASYAYRLYRWDGVDSFDAIANNDYNSTSDDDMNRVWCCCETTNGNIHIVHHDIIGGNHVLRHAYRTLAGAWSSPTTIHTLAGDNLGWLTLTNVDNTVVLAYTDEPGATMQVFARTWTASVGWSSEIAVSDSADGECSSGVSTARVVPDSYVPLMWVQATDVKFLTLKVSSGIAISIIQQIICNYQ